LLQDSHLFGTTCLSYLVSLRQVVRPVGWLRDTVLRFVPHEKGATTIEYGLICVFVLLAIIAGIPLFGPALTNVLSTMASLPTPQ
jgi:Flp pilus assembly pilin Flp